MRFLWPGAFAVMALVPLLILLLAWRQRRRRRFAVRYSSLSLVREALPAQSRLRRYLPLALFLLAFSSLVFGLARPVAVTHVPAGRATVMLVLDVSGSMRQTDIAPSRLAAAKQAAMEFIDSQKDINQIGIVAFARIAQLVQPPSTDVEELKKAIRGLTTGRGTAIGEGILTGLQTIADFNQNGRARATQTAQPDPVAGEDYQPDILVLLTDGVTTGGTDPLEAAGLARDSRVRIYTIGFGTPNGATGEYSGSGDYRRRGWGIDEASLKEIAAMTGGEYYTAGSAGELRQVFDSLPRVLISRVEMLEVSVAFAALAAALVAAAVLLAQLWHPLP